MNFNNYVFLFTLNQDKFNKVLIFTVIVSYVEVIIFPHWYEGYKIKLYLGLV